MNAPRDYRGMVSRKAMMDFGGGKDYIDYLQEHFAKKLGAKRVKIEFQVLDGVRYPRPKVLE